MKRMFFLLLIISTFSCTNIKTKQEDFNKSKNKSIENKEKQFRGYTLIKTNDFLEKIKNKESFIFVSLAYGCSWKESVIEEISNYSSSEIELYLIIFGENGEKDILSQDKEILKILKKSSYQVPYLHLLINGEVKDVSALLTYNNGMKRFIQRNFEESFSYPLKKVAGNPTERRRKALFNGVFSFKDMSGIDLSYTSINNASYESNDMRNINFNNSNLKNINFTYSDLSGASFINTKMDNIFWGHSICPDGTKSHLHNMSCEDNLTPININNIIKDNANIKEKTISGEILDED